MKISKNIRDLHHFNLQQQTPLKDFVDDIALNIRENHPSWHYISRLKSEESFALKIEMGRGYIPDYKTIEDFFACTFVVENYIAIERAYTTITEYFNIIYQRPEAEQPTRKSPENFPFDDLRLYCKVKTSSEPIFKDTLFEIQIKTFLQHAWGIATHDLIYKGDEISWGTHRIAFQIKAMLEHAELSIEQAEILADCDTLKKTNPEFSLKMEISQIINKHWDADNLPSDKKRLINNFVNLLRILDRPPLFLDEVLTEGSAGSSHPANLSPYSTFVQYLIWYRRPILESIAKRKQPKGTIFIDTNLDIPIDLDLKNESRFISI